MELSTSDLNFDYRLSYYVKWAILTGSVSLILNYFNCFVWSLYGQRLTKRVRNMLFESILRKEIKFFDKYTPGELNSKITKYEALLVSVQPFIAY